MTELSTPSLHDALPILGGAWAFQHNCRFQGTVNMVVQITERVSDGIVVAAALNPDSCFAVRERGIVSFVGPQDRKSTRLNSSHGYISYAVFCLKKKHCD